MMNESRERGERERAREPVICLWTMGVWGGVEERERDIDGRGRGVSAKPFLWIFLQPPLSVIYVSKFSSSFPISILQVACVTYYYYYPMAA